MGCLVVWYTVPALTLWHALSQIKSYGVSSALSAEVTVLHDDLLHPVLGGNKLRKLDALIPALQASGVTNVVLLFFAPNEIVSPHHLLEPNHKWERAAVARP